MDYPLDFDINLYLKQKAELEQEPEDTALAGLSRFLSIIKNSTQVNEDETKELIEFLEKSEVSTEDENI